jgi:hypothetical protein
MSGRVDECRANERQSGGLIEEGNVMETGGREQDRENKRLVGVFRYRQQASTMLDYKCIENTESLKSRRRPKKGNKRCDDLAIFSRDDYCTMATTTSPETASMQEIATVVET